MYALQAIGEIVVPAVVDAGPVGDDAQIDIAALGPLALVEAPAPEPFVRRGHRLAEHMRDVKARKRALQQLAEKTKEAEQKDEALQRITRVLPSAAQMLGTVRSSAVGRLKKTEPDHFTVAVRAMHLPARRKVKAGVDVKKLICCGAKIISKRQKVGMAKCLGNAKKVLAHRVDGPRRHVHVNHLHMWDEVACKFRWRPSKKYRQQRKATPVVPRLSQQVAVVMCAPSRHVAVELRETVFPLVVFSAEVDQHVDDGMKRENALRRQINSPTMLLHDEVFQLSAACSLSALISHQPSNRETSQRM